MSKRIFVDATSLSETRLVVADKSQISDVDFEYSDATKNKGNVYLARITRVEPSLQAAFVDFGGSRHGFLPFSEIHPDYFQIDPAERAQLIDEIRERRTTREDTKASAKPAPKKDEDHRTTSESRRKGRKRPRRQTEEKASFDDAAIAHSLADTIDAQMSKALPGVQREGAEGIPEVQEEQKEQSHLREGEAEVLPETQSVIVTKASAFETHADEASEVIDSSLLENKGKNLAMRIEHDDPVLVEGEENKAIVPLIEEETTSKEGEPQDVEEVERIEEDEEEDIRLSHAYLTRHYQIEDVIKRKQVVLVQINKEERGTKGAALTTYLSLPGRYCVLMPNSPRAGGISRKISSPQDRKRLKLILDALALPESLSIIVRTAGSGVEPQDIRRDYQYLMSTWEEIRENTRAAKAPMLVYEEANVIKRAIRDMYTQDTSEIIVEGAKAYRTASEFMAKLMPDKQDIVRQHCSEVDGPIYPRAIELQLEKLHSPHANLPSGGYLVINQTEALVAIDINSGKATKEKTVESTALATNLEAAKEIAKQLRLRQLAGLIVIDFIDMEERKNNIAVEKALRSAFENDRARVQIGRISSFGLLELSRQRLGPSLHEMYRSPCTTCAGLGHVRGLSLIVDSMLRSLAVSARTPNARKLRIACAERAGLHLLNQKRSDLLTIEAQAGVSIEVLIVPTNNNLEDFRIAILDEAGQTLDPIKAEDTASSTHDDKPKRRAPKREDAPKSPKARKVKQRDSRNDEVSINSGDEEEKPKRKRGKRGGRKRGKSNNDEQTEEVREENHTLEKSSAEAQTPLSTVDSASLAAAESYTLQKPLLPQESVSPPPELPPSESSPVEKAPPVLESESTKEPAKESVKADNFSESSLSDTSFQSEPEAVPAKPKRKGWWQFY